MRLVHEKCGSLEQGVKENQMIIVRITSGLGNQMYRYALLLSLKKIYKDIDIKIDTNSYENDKSHTGYILDELFGIKECVASEEECRKVYSGCRYYKGFGRVALGFQPLRMLYQRVYSKIGDLISSGNEPHMIRDYKFNIFNPEVFNLDPKRDWYLSGYWQNLQYFDWNKEEVKKAFDFSLDLDERKKELVAEMLSCNSVSVHVRRGDYIGLGFDLCGDEYYHEAIQKMKERVEDCRFYFFSDDAEYVKAHFGNVENSVIVSNGADEVEADLLMMGKCRHHIIPNSTFSFWPAYLNEAEDSVTICPQYFLSEKGRMYQADYPKNWIRIENAKGKQGLR